MSRGDKVLVCVVSRKPWEMFDAGIKGAEYRGRKWASKMFADHANFDADGVKMMDRSTMQYFAGEIAKDPNSFFPWKTLRLPLGYAKDRPILDIPIQRIDWGLPNLDWTCGIIAPEECFRIYADLSRRIQIQ